MQRKYPQYISFGANRVPLNRIMNRKLCRCYPHEYSQRCTIETLGCFITSKAEYWEYLKTGLYFLGRFCLFLINFLSIHDLQDLSIQFWKLYCIYSYTCRRRMLTLNVIITKHHLRQCELKYILWSMSSITTHASSFISFGECILNYCSGSFQSNIPSLKETYGNSQERMQVFGIYGVIPPPCSFPAHRYQWLRVKNSKLGYNCVVKSWSLLSRNSLTAFFYFMLWKIHYYPFSFLSIRKKKKKKRRLKQFTVIHS